MSIINSQPLIGASGQGGYFLSKSLRFRSSAGAYLNRTPASASNRKTFTISQWIKRGIVNSGDRAVLSVGSNNFVYKFSSSQNEALQIYDYTGSSFNLFLQTSQVFRDVAGWYHLVLAIDTTQATSSNRAKLYVNGVQVTAFSSATYPSQNTDLYFNSNIAHYIGNESGSLSYFDGYQTEVNVIDGQALTPSSFGETSTSTGVWIPKKYTGTYGTNGFYLQFTDVATTSGSNAGLGKDFSGNGNYWTTNNISVTTGTTYDSMTDVPTLTSATAANYAVLNPLDTGGTAPSSANLELIAGAAERGVRSTFAIPTTGLYYAEAVVGTNQSGATDIAFGFVARTTNLSANPSGISNGWLCYATATTNITRNGTSTLAGAGTALVSGDVLQLAIDLANNKGWLGKNNTWFNGTTGTDGNPSTGANPTFTFSSPPELFVLAHCYSSTINVNFGQRPFAYTPPTGFKALNTFNLPTPTIGATASSQAGKYFGINLWTGNGSTGSRAITGLGFKPDWVWWKNRTTAKWHQVFDSNRGADKALSTNATDAEDASGGYGGEGSVTSFDTDGYTLQGGVGNNENGSAIVGWAWQAGQGTNVTNTAGSITSTVSANTTSGFSVVTYTGTGTTGTVGHGLGVAPKMIILKARNQADSWLVYHAGTPNPATNTLILESTGAVQTSSLNWNSTAPTSSVFSVYNPGSGGYSNGNGYTYVAYCFSAVAGYSAFGSYTGNASTDGPFVFTGFRPRFILIKESTPNARGWRIFDTARNPYNQTGLSLAPNASDAEDNGSNLYNQMDILSNGFKLRAGTNSEPTNESGATYIYAAFAESPFKFALAR